MARRVAAADTIARFARGKLARQTLMCPVCADDMPVSAMIAVAADCREAEHHVCQPCERRYVDAAVGEGKLFIRCPGGGCRHLLTRDRIEALASAGKRALHAETVTASHAQRIAREDDGEFLEFARQHARVCPACNVLIYRYEGCNHMTCKCGHEFQWNAAEAQITVQRAARPAAVPNNVLDAAQLGALRLAATEAFDGDNADHAATLRRLWELAFPGEPFRERSTEWKRLGFQASPLILYERYARYARYVR